MGKGGEKMKDFTYTIEEMKKSKAKYVETGNLDKEGLPPGEKWLLSKTQCEKVGLEVGRKEKFGYYKFSYQGRRKGFYVPLYDRTNQFNWIPYSQYDSDPYLISSRGKHNNRLKKVECEFEGYILGEKGFVKVFRTQKPYYDPMKTFHVTKKEKDGWQALFPFELTGTYLGKVREEDVYDVREVLEKEGIVIYESKEVALEKKGKNPYILDEEVLNHEYRLFEDVENDFYYSRDVVHKNFKEHLLCCYWGRGSLCGIYDAEPFFKEKQIWLVSKQKIKEKVYLVEGYNNLRNIKQIGYMEIKPHGLRKDTREPVFDLRKVDKGKLWKKLRVRMMLEYYKDK